MYLSLSNQGLIEAGALSLMGASVKDGSAIGKFGSGFKYALATLIRNGIEVRIFSGLSEIRLETRKETFRATEFDVLWIDGERTSITTQTGREWAVRDAIREIWSNAIDEGQASVIKECSPSPKADRTTVSIAFTPDIQAMYENWELYFCHSVPALHANGCGRILSQPVPNYFRRGIWICEDREEPPLFSYDFRDIELPESRKIKSHSTSYEVYNILSDCGDKKIFENILTKIDAECMEWFALAYWGLGRAGQMALEAAFLERWDYFGNLRFKDRITTSGQRILWVSDRRAETLHKLGFKNIADETDFSETFTVRPWPIGYRERLTQPLATLAAVGVDLSPFKIEYIDFHGDTDSPIALAHKGRCLLTAKAFEVHPHMLMKALVEEWTHLEHKVADRTVAQQHVYLDLIVSLIERNKS